MTGKLSPRMQGPYRDDLDAVRARARRQERANARRARVRRRRLFEPPRLMFAGCALVVGLLFAFVRPRLEGPARNVLGDRALSAEELDAPLDAAARSILETCGVPAGTMVELKVTVQYGEPTHATVRLSPPDATRASCVLDRAGELRWPWTGVEQRASVRWSRD